MEKFISNKLGNPMLKCKLNDILNNSDILKELNMEQGIIIFTVAKDFDFTLNKNHHSYLSAKDKLNEFIKNTTTDLYYYLYFGHSGNMKSRCNDICRKLTDDTGKFSCGDFIACLCNFPDIEVSFYQCENYKNLSNQLITEFKKTHNNILPYSRKR